jgi:peptide subunit release factor 1 (eRF1)
MHYGHVEKQTEIDLDTQRFFRAVDRAIIEHYSKPSGLPLILATLPAHRSLFREVSHNSQLVDAYVDVHPDSLSIDELRERAWKVVEPHYVAQMAATIDAFGSARAHGLGEDDLKKVTAAVMSGRVATLLVEADRVIPGRIDAETGEITLAELSLPDVDDLLDDLTELAAKMGGQVVVVPADRMPTTSGIAAIYRF